MAAGPSPSELGIDRTRAVERIDLDGGASWIELVPGFIRDPEGLLDHVIGSTAWGQGEVWRYDRYVEERRLGAMIRPDSHPTLRQAGLHLDAAYRVRFTGIGAVYYRDGRDFQGLHSDREMKWLDDTRVAILVLGEARPFLVRPRGNPNDPAARRPGPRDLTFHPGHGGLIVLGGRFQRDWLHGVPAAPTDLPRVSVTWRWSARRGRPDTDPSYFDGRHFSDRPNPTPHRVRRR